MARRKARSTASQTPVLSAGFYPLVVPVSTRAFHAALSEAADLLERHGASGHATVARIAADDYVRKCQVFDAALAVGGACERERAAYIERLAQTIEAVRDFRLSEER